MRCCSQLLSLGPWHILYIALIFLSLFQVHATGMLNGQSMPVALAVGSYCLVQKPAFLNTNLSCFMFFLNGNRVKVWARYISSDDFIYSQPRSRVNDIFEI